MVLASHVRPTANRRASPQRKDGLRYVGLGCTTVRLKRRKGCSAYSDVLSDEIFKMRSLSFPSQL